MWWLIPLILSRFAKHGGAASTAGKAVGMMNQPSDAKSVGDYPLKRGSNLTDWASPTGVGTGDISGSSNILGSISSVGGGIADSMAKMQLMQNNSNGSSGLNEPYPSMQNSFVSPSGLNPPTPSNFLSGFPGIKGMDMSSLLALIQQYLSGAIRR
jgi:hypothetical protein